jgi:hypothetical protein
MKMKRPQKIPRCLRTLPKKRQGRRREGREGRVGRSKGHDKDSAPKTNMEYKNADIRKSTI